MFWDIIRCSVGLGLRAGALFGSGYFPLFLLGGQLWALIQRQPSPAHNYTELLTGIIGAAVSGSLLGALAAAKPRVAAAAYAAVNLIAMFSLPYLLFATDLFTNFGTSPLSHAGPNHTINIISDRSTFLLLVVGPALVAAAAAFWASARLVEWYQDETSPPQNFPPYSDTLRSMDHLWPL